MFNESRIDDFFDSLDRTCRIEINKREYDRIKSKAEAEGYEIGEKIGLFYGKFAGRTEKSISVARWMLKRNMSLDDISEAVGMPKEKINSLDDIDYKSFEELGSILEIKKFLEDD